MPRRRRRNWIKQSAICLVLGVIATIAVAWGCAIVIDIESEPSFAQKRIEFGDPYPYWYIDAQQRGCASRIVTRPHMRLVNFAVTVGSDSGVFGELRVPPELEIIPSWTMIDYERTAPQSVLNYSNEYIDDAWSWPALCLASHRHGKWDSTRNMHSIQVQSGIQLPISLNIGNQSGSRTPRFLPLDPIWPNFAYCTLFYAAIAWLLFFSPGTLRRWMRRKKNRCPYCGYDLRGNESSQCPECGHQRRAVATDSL